MLPGLKKNADGSLTIYVQKDNPGAEKESNWLPAPNGPIYLVMRLYWPKEEASTEAGSRRRHARGLRSARRRIPSSRWRERVRGWEIECR